MSQANATKLFGTDGIRGRAGEFPLDGATVERIGRALVVNIAGGLPHAPRLLIGRDTRESGPEIEAALARGALAAGASVESAGVITTPGVAYVTRARGFDAGIVISASHNPFTDNGIKVFSPTGKKLADEMEQRIERDLATGGESAEEAAASTAFDLQRSHDREAEYQAAYLSYLSEEIAAGLRLDGMRIGLDCANGAAWHLAPELFRRLGAHAEVIGDTPDGRNINEGCGSLHLEGLQRLVVERHLDLGVAFDGDADRSLFVDAEGRLVDGDVTLLILADEMKRRDELEDDTVVATVMSNIGLELALGERGIKLVRANVGDRYVLEELLARDARLGGEQSGHIIFPAISLAGDGMITAIELLRAVRAAGRRLGDLAAAMKRFPQVLVNVRVRRKVPFDSLPEVKMAMENLENQLQGRGRLLVRYSGTENLARIMIEGEEQEQIEAQASALASCIREAIGE
ncbi:MAG TPA: phosphoglucosamine mutase [Blastocatellia bacterium]|nr:phosphoglucosamine mutase [Blastocatellia bacterium]